MAIAILFAKIINFREISTKVTTDSVWLLQHRLLIQFMKRKSVFKTRKRHTTKLPRKSIQGYLAMYPRINRQVSSITLPSILASFFTRFHWTRFLSMYWASSQHRESHTDSVVTSHFEKALRSDFTAGDNAGEPLSGQNTLAAETFRLSSPFFQIELVTLLNQGINSSETINYANKQGHTKREGSVGPICQIL